MAASSDSDLPHKLILAIGLFLVLVVVAVTAQRVSSLDARVAQADKSLEHFAYANVMLDDLGRERTEAIYLTALKDSAPDEYESRVESTDSIMSVLSTAVADEDWRRSLSDVGRESLNRTRPAVLALGPLREDVRRGTASPEAVATRYTAVIDSMIAEMGVLIHDRLGETTFGEAFVALATLDDRIGLEDALGQVAFAQGWLPEPLRAEFERVIETQQVQRTQYHANTDAAAASALNLAFHRTGTASLTAMRDAVWGAGEEGAVLERSEMIAWSESMRARHNDVSMLRGLRLRDETELFEAATRARMRSALLQGVIASFLVLILMSGALLVLRRQTRNGTASDSGADGGPAALV